MGKQVQGKDWVDACGMWQSGRFTLAEIAEKYDVTISALHRRFKRHGIEKGAHAELEKKAISQVIQSHIKESDELARVITEVRELNLKGSIMLSKRVLLEIKRASDANKPLSSIEGTIKSLERASKILNTNYNTAEKILHLDSQEGDDDEELPVLEVRRLTDSDVAQIRQEQESKMRELTGEEDFNEEDLDALDVEDLVQE